MKDFFDRTEVLSILQGLNPWWTGRTQTLPGFRRLGFDICHQHLVDVSLRRAILLSGPRRVGKTTILCQIAQHLIEKGRVPKSIFYLSLDHPILKLLPLSEILRIYHESIHPEGRQAVLLLDEVQYSPRWDLQIKHLIDHKSEYRILATGSASATHRQRLSESGVGRWIHVPIPTLSFYEFLQIRGEDTSQIPGSLRPTDLFPMDEGELAELACCFRGLMPHFQRYLLVGGFPETARQADVSFCQRLLREDVIERVLKRDMTALFGVRNVNDLEKLFTYLCIHSGGVLGVKTCADALGTSPTTVSNHLAALEQANLIYRLSPWGRGGKKVLKARYKVYLVDAALRNAVLLRGEEVLNNPTEMGLIVETTVLRHLCAYYYRDVPEVLYWRDARSNREVDVIVRSPAYVIPVEVKYRQRPTLNEQDGLYAFCRQEKPDQAYFVTQRDSDFGTRRFGNVGTQFLQIPAHIFAYLLGQAERLLWQRAVRTSRQGHQFP